MGAIAAFDCSPVIPATAGIQTERSSGEHARGQSDVCSHDSVLFTWYRSP